MQSIKVQTAQGKVESAILHVINMETNNADKRLVAMVRQTPLHAFMFNAQGKLLVANDAAMEACLHSAAGLKIPEGQDITLKALFALGAYEGDPAVHHSHPSLHCSFESTGPSWAPQKTTNNCMSRRMNCHTQTLLIACLACLH